MDDGGVVRLLLVALAVRVDQQGDQAAQDGAAQAHGHHVEQVKVWGHRRHLYVSPSHQSNRIKLSLPPQLYITNILLQKNKQFVCRLNHGCLLLLRLFLPQWDHSNVLKWLQSRCAGLEINIFFSEQ